MVSRLQPLTDNYMWAKSIYIYICIHKSRFENVWYKWQCISECTQPGAWGLKNAEATNEILSWEPISETWSKPDLKLATQRAYHAVTELDLKWFLLTAKYIVQILRCRRIPPRRVHRRTSTRAGLSGDIAIQFFVKHKFAPFSKHCLMHNVIVSSHWDPIPAWIRNV